MRDAPSLRVSSTCPWVNLSKRLINKKALSRSPTGSVGKRWVCKSSKGLLASVWGHLVEFLQPPGKLGLSAGQIDQMFRILFIKDGSGRMVFWLLTRIARLKASEAIIEGFEKTFLRLAPRILHMAKMAVYLQAGQGHFNGKRAKIGPIVHEQLQVHAGF